MDVALYSSDHGTLLIVPEPRLDTATMNAFKVKVAVTVVSALTRNEHVGTGAVQSTPVQPAKIEPGLAAAVNVTISP